MPLKTIDGKVYIIEEFNEYKHNYIKAIDNNDMEWLKYIFNNNLSDGRSELIEKALDYSISCNNLNMTRKIINCYIDIYEGDEFGILKGLSTFARNMSCSEEIIYYLSEL